ncbi:MAG: hypothetical protein ACYS0D_06880 [Planctomycetota bacterium]|jgi:1,2-phenylacetyl-CoA epoxidase PaaB subunit
MSRIRDQVDIIEGELESPAEGDLSAYVVFTQLADGGPFIYAGWLDARDDAMAIQFAREHYGRDQKCTAVLVIARRDIAGTEAEFAPSSEKGAERDFQVFIQSEMARRETAKVQPDSIWVVPRDRLIATDADDLVWRLTDQSYRMARGYSSEVRAKWEKIRARPDLEEYEKEDLKEAF